jgi:hypothetical protein
MAGWSQKSRREGPKKENDKLDIINLRYAMFSEGELMNTSNLTTNTREGITQWVKDFGDEISWRHIRVNFPFRI